MSRDTFGGSGYSYYDNGAHDEGYKQYLSPNGYTGPETIESRDQHHFKASSSSESRHESSPPWNPSPSFERVCDYATTIGHNYHQVHYAPPAQTFPYMPSQATIPNYMGFHGTPCHSLHPYHVESSSYWAPPGPPPIVEYITQIEPEDVLSGRGGATNSHSGNRAFRTLVKDHQNQYLKAKKRDKPAVASMIVDLVRKKGGRFLRRWDTNAATGQVLWVDIGDDRAREKTCQALREGAPELRRRKRICSSDEDDVKPHGANSQGKRSGEADSSPSSTSKSRGDMSDLSKTTMTNSALTRDYNDKTSNEDGTIVIRPLVRLLPRGKILKPIPLEQLTKADRDIYLRDFFPPAPPESNATTKTTADSHIPV